MYLLNIIPAVFSPHLLKHKLTNSSLQIQWSEQQSFSIFYYLRIIRTADQLLEVKGESTSVAHAQCVTPLLQEVPRTKMAEILLGGKKLSELKVTELKAELDKRGLPKTGVKSVLRDRLKKAILHEELTKEVGGRRWWAL